VTSHLFTREPKHSGVKQSLYQHIYNVWGPLFANKLDGSGKICLQSINSQYYGKYSSLYHIYSFENSLTFTKAIEPMYEFKIQGTSSWLFEQGCIYRYSVFICRLKRFLPFTSRHNLTFQKSWVFRCVKFLSLCYQNLGDFTKLR
jgi:hypothetical protein